MPFDYYRRLTPRQKRIYRASDEVATIPIPTPATLRRSADKVRRFLEAEDRPGLERACQELVDELARRLEVPPLSVKVLAARPSRTWGELHGLYEPAENRRRARITVWMRTAHRRQVVAFRTFLRTVLHEVCHHLDYELLGFEETFHTEGFFKRESSLFHQLTGSDRRSRAVP